MRKFIWADATALIPTVAIAPMISGASIRATTDMTISSSGFCGLR
jgi:hypothetical protein